MVSDSTETGRVTWPGEVGQDLREGAEASWFFWEMFWVMSTESRKLFWDRRIETV